MGLINRSAREYYQSSDLGDYQFTSLSNIINQFEIAYVGEGKIIPKVNKLDIAFHAQRALQELSFDTLKAVKSQEIVLPPSLTMILPQDYVNYTKLSWVDSSGIKHPLYKTNSTSNPFSILQNTDGSYNFIADNITGLLTNGNFDGGVVKESTFKKYKNRGLVSIASFENVTKPWLVRSGLDDKIYNTLKKSLLKLKDKKVLKSIKKTGFLEVEDEDYTIIKESMDNSSKF